MSRVSYLLAVIPYSPPFTNGGDGQGRGASSEESREAVLSKLRKASPIGVLQYGKGCTLW